MAIHGERRPGHDRSARRTLVGVTVSRVKAFEVPFQPGHP